MFRVRPVPAALAVLFGTLAIAALDEPVVLTPLPLASITTPLRAGASPLLFEPNAGQYPHGVAFAVRAKGFLATIEGGRIDFHLPPRADGARGSGEPQQASMVFVGAAPAPRVEGTRRHTSIVNVAHGRSPSGWVQRVPTFSEIRVAGLYPGVDLVVFGTDAGVLEYNLVLDEGADASQVRMRFHGSERLEIARDGSLMVHLRAGVLRHGRPHSFVATAAGVQEVPSRFRLEGADTVAFEVDAAPGLGLLTIDPTLAYSSFVGGHGADAVLAVASTGDGGFLVAGSTQSATLAGGALRSDPDAFVARYDAAGRQVFATYLGGSGADTAMAVALDGSTVGIAGLTCSVDFPVQGAAQPAPGGACDAFVAWLDASTGAVQRSTFLGGSGSDVGAAIAMGGGGTVVAGATQSPDFPLLQPAFAFAGGGDAFVTRYGAAGNVVFSTTIGGVASDQARTVVVDTAGDVHAGGSTRSPNFPRLNTALPGHSADPNDADGWVASFTAAGDLRYATLIGGSGSHEQVMALAVAPDASIWLTGNVVPRGAAAGSQAFVARLVRPPGIDTSVDSVYQRTLGGSGSAEVPAAIALDPSGIVHIAGSTTSGGLFPYVEPLQARQSGQDAFVASLNPSANQWDFATVLGGSGADAAYGLAMLPGGDLLVGGASDSSDFPLVAPAFGGPGATGYNGFVARVGRTSPGMNDTGDTVTCTLAGSATPPCMQVPVDSQVGRDPAVAMGAVVRQGGGLAGFDFSRVTNAGGVLAPVAPPPSLGNAPGDWACTRDNTTGLTWEVKTADGGLRDRAWRYTWYSTLPGENGGVPGDPGFGAGTCGGALARCATDAYIEALNAAKLCGHADWRMPTARELSSIAVTSSAVMSVRIDTAYFPNTQPESYWTATPFASDTAFARVLNFANGWSGAASKQVPGGRVLAVRGPRR